MFGSTFSKYGSWAPWLDTTKKTLVDSYGLDNDFAEKMAIALAYFQSEGLAPRISRGWSDPKHQKELRDRWDRGDRAGLRVRPAADSLHTTTNWLGKPQAKAIDIPTSNDTRAAQIARALGIGAGMDFKDSDPGHFYQR